MNNNSPNVYIIGAGVSGLIAAIELEKAGYAPTIIHQTDSVGGRVKTDHINGYLMDHGFQVLLTCYPAAREYLNYKALNLQPFLPGSVIYYKGKRYKIGDPLRSFSFLFPTLFSPIGSFSDKLKILSLANQVKKKSIESIFEEPELTTLEFLQEFGFSKNIIQRFFRPFFAGIFLEPDLNTSSRMFQFVYKMFGEGYAALPAKGIQAIPDQLKGRLNATTFMMNTTVKRIEGRKVGLENGKVLEGDGIIVATDPSKILPSYANQEVSWHSCYNLYFKTNQSSLQEPIIGLIADENALVNNLYFTTDLLDQEGEEAIVSATVVRKHNLEEKELIEKVGEEIKSVCKLEKLEFLKLYSIPKALPKLNNIKYSPTKKEVKITEGLYVAGDFTANASLNAAMLSGKVAATALIDDLQAG